MPNVYRLSSFRLCIAAAAFGATTLLSACGESVSAPTALTPIVDIHEVRLEPYVLQRELPGRIEAIRVAQVRARVAGIVLERRFEEGADVKEGDVLFRIDPAPFEAELARAQGELARSQAQRTEASAIVKRYQPLVQIEAVSRQEFDNALATLRTAEATLISARANVKTAQLNLGYCTVRAPISGRVGRAMVTEGALVGQGEATPLATIQQIDRVYADFVQPAGEVQRLREALANGQVKPDNGAVTSVSVLVDGASQALKGSLLFSDISVDRGTGQLSLRSVVDNPALTLLPGMYVRVRIDQGTSSQAVLVPQRAVHRTSTGQAQVLVVDTDNVVHRRNVETGRMQEARWHIVNGLMAGERVVTGGAARAGQTVQVRTQTASAG
ncbi:efflux RND transporter periplasmic adaptor subunit [Bordetella tumulicola]|uniref:efflux RND transporter periplasmic adaptor subunit n=1 Tax=Bordetella tumulicola TaxID=1649133 RepID=UPI0039F108CF